MDIDLPDLEGPEGGALRFRRPTAELAARFAKSLASGAVEGVLVEGHGDWEPPRAVCTSDPWSYAPSWARLCLARLWLGPMSMSMSMNVEWVSIGLDLVWFDFFFPRLQVGRRQTLTPASRRESRVED